LPEVHFHGRLLLRAIDDFAASLAERFHLPNRGSTSSARGLCTRPRDGSRLKDRSPARPRAGTTVISGPVLHRRPGEHHRNHGPVRSSTPPGQKCVIETEWAPGGATGGPGSSIRATSSTTWSVPRRGHPGVGQSGQSARWAAVSRVGGFGPPRHGRRRRGGRPCR
jgi:hypothetical protein